MAFIQEDLVKLKLDDGESLILAWGDEVEVLGQEDGRTRVRVAGRGGGSVEGTVRGNLPTQPEGVLQFSMVDVQQGDGMVLQTPRGQVMFIDGGDNQLFARYAAARFKGTSAEQPLDVAAILVTHGDADHFAGLSEIFDCETHAESRKRLFLLPRKVFHNGIVKGPSNLSVEEIFGRTVDTEGGEKAIVDLEDDLREVPEERLNVPFKKWQRCLKHWSTRGDIEVQRLAFGMSDAFDFLAEEDISVDVYGPITQRVEVDGEEVDALPLLHEPRKTVTMPDDEGEPRAFSASHTINGHSVVLRIRYGNVRFLFGADLNQESMEILRNNLPSGALAAEILKVPHHGSADFDDMALRAIAPVVSLISSGDESSRKEFIHPRANLMGAVGKASRGDMSLVFCTELAAFFQLRGKSKDAEGKDFFGFERTSFGIIHVRTDGERVLVFTHSGKEEMKEAYRFRVDEAHRVRSEDVKKR
jgi:hypothetical protein